MLDASPRVNSQQESPKPTPLKSKNNCNREKILGIILLVLGLFMVLSSGALASGAVGGSMYFVAGGLTLTSVIPIIVAAYLLSKSPKELKGSQAFFRDTNYKLDSVAFRSVAF